MGDVNSVEAMGFGWSGGILRPSGSFSHDAMPGTIEPASPLMVAHGWGLTARTVRQSRPRNVLQPFALDTRMAIMPCGDD